MIEGRQDPMNGFGLFVCALVTWQARTVESNAGSDQ